MLSRIHLPSTLMEFFLVFFKPQIISIIVLLPDPLGPIIPTFDPFGILIDISFKIVT